jgi:small subunit ribosomal protein S6
MKQTYEATYILNLQGKSEGVEEVIDSVRKAVTALQGSVQSVQRMDQRRFERVAGKEDSGYYLGVTFELDRANIKELEKQFVFDGRFYRQFYLKTQPAAASA